MVAVDLRGRTRRLNDKSIPAAIVSAIKAQRCAVLGTSNPECDHKDGHRDDWGDPAKFTVDDFQPLSSPANKAKRQACKECRQTKRRFDATVLGFAVAQFVGNGVYEGSCVGCYWHDVRRFHAEVGGKRPSTSREKPLDDEAMTSIKDRWSQLRSYVEAAINLSQKMSTQDDLREDHDLRWGLVKHVENAQETVRALDKAGGDRLLSVLVELPLKADGDELSWKGLIGMRNVLAHKPWDVDHTVVWQTVMEEFPILLTLIDATTIDVEPSDVVNGRHPKILVDPRTLMAGSGTTIGGRMSPIGTQVLVFRDLTHGLGTLHVGRSNDGTSRLVAATPEWARKRWSMGFTIGP